MINWYACSMTRWKIDSEQATALINYDLIMSPWASRSSIHSQRTEKVYLNGAALSPLCAPRPGYDGRMTTNSSTSRPAADARATEYAANATDLIILAHASVRRARNYRARGWVDTAALCLLTAGAARRAAASNRALAAYYA